MKNQIFSTTCGLLAIGALAAITFIPDQAESGFATAPPPGQVSNETRTVSPAQVSAACQCDPRDVADLELRVAALEARYRELLVRSEETKQDSGNWFDGTHWRNGDLVHVNGVWVTSSKLPQTQSTGSVCGPGGCSTGVFGGRIFGRR